MRLRIVRDGKAEEVEVATDLSSVTVGGKTFPVTIVKATALRTELEIGGERAMVEGWPEPFPDPPSPVDVNGERGTVTVERLGSAPSLVSPGSTGMPSGPTAPPPEPAALPGGGVAVVPPMPGRVIELRVAEGARVQRGDVLLVLEAMKMRNEIASPATGVVRGLRVAAGANARAKEPMLFVAPE